MYDVYMISGEHFSNYKLYGGLNMNKKIATMAISLAVGGTLLISTGFANAAQISGYDAYKSAISATKNLKNETADVKVSVVDKASGSSDSSDLVKLSSNVKLDLKSNAMSSTTTLTKGTTAQTSDNYLQDGKSISKDSNSTEYLVKTNNIKGFNKMDKMQSPTVEKSMQVVVDTLVGNMKDGVTTTSNTDGTKSIAINLNEKEVTPLVDALAQIAFIQGTNHENVNSDNSKGELGGLKNVLPQLTSDIKIQSVTSTGKINKDDIITNQTAEIVVSGKDAQSLTHKITFNIDLNLSGINSTSPDKIDLTGKQVKEITSNYERN